MRLVGDDQVGMYILDCTIYYAVYSIYYTCIATAMLCYFSVVVGTVPLTIRQRPWQTLNHKKPKSAMLPQFSHLGVEARDLEALTLTASP